MDLSLKHGLLRAPTRDQRFECHRQKLVTQEGITSEAYGLSAITVTSMGGPLLIRDVAVVLKPSVRLPYTVIRPAAARAPSAPRTPAASCSEAEAAHYHMCYRHVVPQPSRAEPAKEPARN